ncbi:hypothetical protein GCM10010315_58100 [Streptomyces luteosporeus]|uniref:Uncharacterized protein n=1 Tax=Streptomyces luteosporeus TaxID=173856 RepID=A0ABN3U6Y2_9ACTN
MGAGAVPGDAGVRARKVLAGTAGTRRSCLRAGRPDTDNVWHRVPLDKTLRANNFSQMSSGGHA